MTPPSTAKCDRIAGQRFFRSAWIHPLVVFWLTWLTAIALYNLHLSLWLIYSTNAVIVVVAWILIPFSVTTMVYLGFSPSRAQRIVEWSPDSSLGASKLTRRLQVAFAVWLLLTVWEIAVSGGVPLLWLIQGNSLSYVDFGIASLHGLLNSLILAMGLIEFSIFALTRQKQHLWLPTFVILWSLIVVTRNMLVVMLLESAFAWAMIRGISWKSCVRASASLLLLVFLFGYIGDARTGGDEFRDLARPSPDYPEWLPSGVLWVYIYLSTPMNNLVNTVQTTVPLKDYLFPNATSLLFPSVARGIIYKSDTIANAVSGDLVTDTFNVSTAYVGAFQDFGMLGVTCFSILFAGLSAHFWRDRSFRGSMIYAVLGQCLALSIFFNHLFYLPVITQVVWLYILLPSANGSRHTTNHPPMRRFPAAG